jgi:carbohydrate diacid regulator
MALIEDDISQAAQTIVEGIYDLLGMAAIVVNAEGIVVAAGDAGSVGLPYREPEGEASAGLRVPFALHDQRGEVIIAGGAESRLPAQELARGMIDLLINQARVVSGLPSQYELRNRFIHDVLRGTAGTEADIRRTGHILGISFRPTRAVILVEATEYLLAPMKQTWTETAEARAGRRAQLLISSIFRFFNRPGDVLCAHIGDGQIAVLKTARAEDRTLWIEQGHNIRAETPWTVLAGIKHTVEGLLPRLRNEIEAPITAGIGRYYTGIRGLIRSYREARGALRLGCEVYGPNRVYTLDQMLLAAFAGLNEMQTKRELARQLLRPLDAEPELCVTLAAYFAQSCVPSTTAQRLAIHRNTLNYRLDKITTLTGLDPRNFEEAVQLRLALLLDKRPG